MANTIIFNSKDATDYFNPLAGAPTTPHYVFAARSEPWTNDASIPEIETTSAFTDYEIHDEMIFGKLISAADISFMCQRRNWTYNTIYDYYDPQDPDLADKDFFVVYQESGDYHVFKCLNNAGGIASIYPPKLTETSIDDNQYRTAEGYHWKYVYTIPQAKFTKFATDDFMPVISNTTIQAASTNGAISACVVELGGASYYSYANGNFIQIAVGSNTQVFSLSANNLSSNTDFYVGSTLYIQSGPGAGELRDIIDYTISGNSKLCSVNSAFNTLPDLTSTFSISPKVSFVGDGSGALAISSVNTSTKAIQSVTMISEGSDYTYATVSVTGNTGGLTIANSAVVSAMIAPPGGHASNPKSELYANRIGVSVDFDISETQIPSTGSYRRIGLMSTPTYSNVVVAFSNATGNFVSGETVVQQQKETFDLSVYNSDQYEFSYTYTVNNYSIIQFTAPVSFANDQVLSAAGNTIGVVVDKISTNSILVRKDQGAWVNGTVITLSSNASVNGTISNIGSAFSNGVFYGLDNSNTLLEYASTTDTFVVFVNNTQITTAVRAGITDPQFSVNATAVRISNQTISNTSIAYIDKYTANLVQSSLTSNSDLFVSGIVSSSNATHLVLNSVNGLITNNELIIGQSSTSQANVTGIVGQETSFDQRTHIVGQYDTGSAAFSTSNTVYQYDSANNVVAFGTIHAIANSGNTYTISLTGVKGVFEPTSNSGNKYIQSVTGSKKIVISSVRTPYIEAYSPEILYVENMLPTTKSNTQSETIRFVLKFY